MFQVGRCQIFLVSPDTKKVSIEKSFREISFCSQVGVACSRAQADVCGCLLDLQRRLVSGSFSNLVRHTFTMITMQVVSPCPSLPFQGIRHVDHFGFICRETVEGGSCHFVCYVFQCTDEALVGERDGDGG